MIFIDTGYLLALVNARDELHDVALAWSRWIDDSLLLTEYIIVETVDALSDRSLRHLSRGMLERLVEHPHITIVPASIELLEAGIALHRERADKDWSLTDCISFVAVARHDIQKALAHDHHYAQAGFDPLLRRLPTEH